VHRSSETNRLTHEICQNRNKKSISTAQKTSGLQHKDKCINTARERIISRSRLSKETQKYRIWAECTLQNVLPLRWVWYISSTTQIMCVQVIRLRTNFKFIFTLQQLHNIASGAYVPGHGARLTTRVYAGRFYFIFFLSSQFTGRSACYMMRVISLHEAECLQEYYHRGNYFQHLLRLLCQCIRTYFKCNQTEIHRELLVT
jgi:hypothetical protein